MTRQVIGFDKTVELLKQGYDIIWIPAPSSKAIIKYQPAIFYTIRFKAFCKILERYQGNLKMTYDNGRENYKWIAS